MRFLNFLETKKHKQLIKSVRAYYNQESTSIPYNANQIQKTIDWLQQSGSDENKLLAEKLNMAKQIARPEKISTKALVL